MAERGRCRRRGLAAMALAVLAIPAQGDVQAHAALAQEGAWRLESALGAVSGRFLVVRDQVGESWRLEVGVDEGGVPVDEASLLARRGRGWTFCGGDEGAFVQPWHEAWEPLGPATARFLASLLQALQREDGRGGGTTAPGMLANRRAPARIVLETWDDLPPAWRPPRRGPGPSAGRLRTRLVARGLGRGGPGLVLDHEVAGPVQRLTSARWPATIELRPDPGHTLPQLPPEAYLPLWPLAVFVGPGAS